MTLTEAKKKFWEAQDAVTTAQRKLREAEAELERTKDHQEKIDAEARKELAFCRGVEGQKHHFQAEEFDSKVIVDPIFGYSMRTWVPGDRVVQAKLICTSCGARVQLHSGQPQ